MGLALAMLRLALEMGSAASFVELLVLVPAGAVVYGAVVWLLSPSLFGMATRAAALMTEPLRRKPVISKEAET